jgi:hypothetical protein
VRRALVAQWHAVASSRRTGSLWWMLWCLDRRSCIALVICHGCEERQLCAVSRVAVVNFRVENLARLCAGDVA